MLKKETEKYYLLVSSIVQKHSCHKSSLKEQPKEILSRKKNGFSPLNLG